MSDVTLCYVEIIRESLVLVPKRSKEIRNEKENPYYCIFLCFFLLLAIFRYLLNLFLYILYAFTETLINITPKISRREHKTKIYNYLSSTYCFIRRVHLRTEDRTACNATDEMARTRGEGRNNGTPGVVRRNCKMACIPFSANLFCSSICSDRIFIC